MGFDALWRKIRGVFLSLILVAGVGVGLLGRELLVVLTTPRFYDADQVVAVAAFAACLQAMSLMFMTLLVAAKKTFASTKVVMLGAG